MARRARGDARNTWRAARAAVVGLRDHGFSVRVVDEDEPLFLAAELERGGARSHLQLDVLPDGQDSELELRLEGEAPITGLAALLGDPGRARDALERRLISRLKRELGAAWSDEETRTFRELRRALRETRAGAARAREKRAEVESAFAAGLIDERERARLLARLNARGAE